MATTYDGTAIGSSSKDRARHLLGDTGILKDEAGSAVWLMSDEEIAALIATFGFNEGVAQCADGLSVRFAQSPDSYKDEAGVEVSWGERIDAWQNLAARLRSGTIQQESARTYRAPQAGQISSVDVSKIL